ncbi:unnamed protein product [Camellia sinensis]|uniref:SNRNP25 ubiquitin-like domain-containing protein n=1 Tax=Camellia sinensis var. sinensis TaxID=542762 RepID=A0A4S4F0D6_CAMSN|nr:uncharacterized protein LOC114255774 [Camellia sinensis]THG22868.1 hypothetical protein TEA_025565 [Camellia sinensis var. sinensis]
MVKIMPGIEQEDQSFRVLDQLSLNNLLSLSYHRLPQQLLNLSILKLDGSSFEVNVARNATIADLKQAVEEIFSLSQKDCEGKISWSHVWGHFCLCYEGQKLINDKVYIRNFGIKDGDQLKFIRNMSINYRPVKQRSKNIRGASKQCSMGEQTSTNEDEEEVLVPKFKLTRFLNGRLSFSNLRSSTRKGSMGRRSHSLRISLH